MSHLKMANPKLRIAFIGAGGIHFGSPEGPWNHSARLEALPDVIPSFIIDCNVNLAQSRLDECRKGPYPEKWKSTQVLSSVDELLAMDPVPCDAVFIGVPPAFHGGTKPQDIALELRCAERGLNVFVEKPISLRTLEEVKEVECRLREAQKRCGIIVAVGYMLRYSMVVQKAKELLKGFQVAAVIARYHCSYSSIAKEQWWDVAQSGGPIIEQATHFADLLRYFGGEVVGDTVHSVSLSANYPLIHADEFEKNIPMKQRIDRATAASFLFENGAVGSLTHTALLHGNCFDTVIEIVADGIRVVVRNPYDENPQLLVRKPETMVYEEIEVEKRDMYHDELSGFVRAAITGDASGVLSPYSDAVNTYKLTRWIADRKISR